MFLKRKVGVTERPRSLNPSKAIAMAICPIIVHFSSWRARSMHDVACEFARAVVRSKDAQKQLARTSVSWKLIYEPLLVVVFSFRDLMSSRISPSSRLISCSNASTFLFGPA